MEIHENSGRGLKKVVVCPPDREYFEVENLAAHNFREVPDKEVAKRQYKALVNVMRDVGVEVVEVKELRGHPNSVFAMDTATALGYGYIKLRMGLKTRRGEEEWMAKNLENLGLEKIGEIAAPGTAEGGDLIPAYPVFFIGNSGRTNLEGARQIARIVENLGYEARIIPVPEKHLHLGGAMTLIGEDRVLACKSIADEYLKGFEVVRLNCGSFITGNVIYLGRERVIVERRNEEAFEKLKAAGYEVFQLDLSEFVKGSGGPSCLVLPVNRVSD